MGVLFCVDDYSFLFWFFFFFNDTATTEIYTLSLHDALPISRTRPSGRGGAGSPRRWPRLPTPDRKSTRLNSSHQKISYAVFCLKKQKNKLTTCTSGPSPDARTGGRGPRARP